MSSQTPNINLTLPTGAENVSRQIINDNNTKIDTAIGTLNSKIGHSTIIYATTLADLKTNLLAAVNSVGSGDLLAVRITPQFSSDGFSLNSTYGGYAYNIYKANGVTSYFSAILSNNIGDDMLIGYNNGSWFFNSVSKKTAYSIDTTSDTTTSLTGNATTKVEFDVTKANKKAIAITAVSPYYPSTLGIQYFYFDMTNQKATVYIKNTSSSAQTGVNVSCLYINT